MNSEVHLTRGIPPHEFFAPAWESEPLTGALRGTDLSFALPPADEDASLIAKDLKGRVIGQCSANRLEKYWSHLDQTDSSPKGRPTQLFMKIHRLAIEEEKRHLNFLKAPLERAFHNAGIAVLPACRGKGLGRETCKGQIELCKKLGASIIYCETTNRYSAALMKEEGFTLLREFPYAQLTKELQAEELSELNDSFSVWCFHLSGSPRK